MRHFVALKTLRLSMLIICCGLLGLTTACSSSEDATPTTTENAASDATATNEKGKMRKPAVVERFETGTVLRALNKYLIVMPDGANKKVILSRSEATEVSGIREYWHDLDKGYRVEVTWTQHVGVQNVAKQIVVLSKGDNVKPPLSELEAELDNPPAS
jgi:hypothetical protein